VKQSKWKEKVEYLKTEILKRGKEKEAPEILQQFCTRLSATILHFFAESDSFSPDDKLTVAQKAFTHSLQLYDLHSVMRLVDNYDVSKGMKVVIPGIEKSYRSLMVVPRLEGFIKNSLESTALGVYKFRLEDSLSSFLKCDRAELYKEDFLTKKIKIVSSYPNGLRGKFFTERLRTLFSSNYRIYLLLKNRYFLKLLFRYANNPKNFETIKNIDTNNLFTLESNKKISIKKLEENFDFRSLEQFVKTQIFKNENRNSFISESRFIKSMENFKSDSKSDLISVGKNFSNSNKTGIMDFNFRNHKTYFSIKKEEFQENISAYLKLVTKFKEPLIKIVDSFCPVSECSSPYFMPRAEDYRIEFSNFFRKILDENVQVIKDIHEFTLELLTKRGEEYNAAQRWEMVSMVNFKEKSTYYRKTEKGKKFLDRKTEWSILIHFSTPFNIELPMVKGEKIKIDKDKPCLFQIGTAFFDHGHQKKIKENPDVFFKLMFGGHTLTSKNAVIHVGNDPYFTITLSQMWYCRGLIYLFFIAISQRFAIELSSSIKDFLVKFIPQTVDVEGFNICPSSIS
tara:strand:- start:467 stop:2167 length:1701 start_codon:yes stop_codon:yes gene_type:complete